LIANLCADTRCRGDRPFRHALTRLNIVEASNCVMKLQYIGDWRPATIPMVDVWQIAIRSPDLYDITVVIRWWADAERDAWYLEDINNRTDNAGWRAQPGSAIFVLHVHGPRGVDDGDGFALMLDHYADLCKNRQGPPQSLQREISHTVALFSTDRAGTF